MPGQFAPSPAILGLLFRGAVDVVITALTNSYASANRPNTHANFFRERRGRKHHTGSENQSVFHRDLLSLLRWREIKGVAECSRIQAAYNFHSAWPDHDSLL
jgi:hypothetical protein